MNNSQVAHAWAHGQSGKGSNLKSDGVSLTSYSTTIAAHIDDVFYISDDNMSQSTGRHISYARQALGWNNPNVFYTTAFSWSGSNPALTHNAMIQPAARSAESKLHYALNNSKTRKKTKLDAIAAYIQERQRIVDHAAKYGVTLIMPEMVMSEDAINEFQAAKAAAEAKKEELRIKAQKKQQKEDKAQFKLWLTTGAGRCPYSFQERGNDFITIAGHVTDGENNTIKLGRIVTSQGAECPLDHAVKALRFWESRRVDGELGPFKGKLAIWEPYHTNGHKIPLGIFTLDSIDETGTVKAGCHTFTAKEIQRFIAQWREVLGL